MELISYKWCSLYKAGIESSDNIAPLDNRSKWDARLGEFDSTQLPHKILVKNEKRKRYHKYCFRYWCYKPKQVYEPDVWLCGNFNSPPLCSIQG